MNTPIFRKNMALSKKLYPQICEIMNPLVSDLSVAPEKDDLQRCTDLMVLNGSKCGQRVACRLRRYDQIQYSNEITLRYTQCGGGKTEFEKLIKDNTKLDYYFYAFTNDTETDIVAYKIISWPSLRDSLIDGFFSGSITKDKQCGKKDNFDGSSFIWVDMRYFQNSIIKQGV